MKEKLWTKDYLIGVSVLFGICFVGNLVLSVFPIFAKNLTGLDTYAGLMTTAYATGALSMRFVSGKLVDRFRSKRVVLSGIALTLITTILYIYCQNIYLALFYRVIQGIGFGIAQTGISTYITKIVARSRVMEAVNYAALFNFLTSVIGPSIAFALIGTQYDRFGLLFIMSAIISVITFILMFFTKQENTSIRHKQEQTDQKSQLPWTIIMIGSFILFFSSLSQSAITSFVSLYAISLDISNIGSFFFVNALGVISSRFVTPTIIKKIGTFRTMLLNSIIFCVSLIVISQISQLWKFLIVAFPAGFALGSITPAINVFLIHKFPENQSGVANAMYYSAMDIAYASGSVLWGGVASSLGYGNMFFISGMVMVICIILSIVQFKVFKEI